MEFVESQTLEFKEQFNDSCKHTIVAFLSHGSGTIYIGINKNGKPVKLDDIDAIQRDISNFLIDQVSPRCIELVKTSLEDVGGYTVIKINVTQGDKLFYIKKYGLSVKGCYIRVGSTTREMTDEEIMTKYESNLPEPLMREYESPSQKLTFDILKTSLREHGFHINDGTFLDNYKLLTSKGKYNLIADLFADENDISIKIARFEGTTKAKLIERTEYGYKSIILAIRRTLDRFEALNITKSTIKVPQRVDKKLFNMDALREAFINAIAHTKWTEFNPPQIQVFSNRIEIISTGRPIKDLSKEDFFKGVSKQRNPELMRILHDLEFVEQTGFGVPTIVDAYGTSAYEFLDNFVKVTIPFDEEVMTMVNKDVTDNVTDNVTESDEQIIIKLIKDNPSCTRNDMAKAIGKTVRTVQRVLNASTKIRRVGGDYGGHWEVVD
ncbi:MAG: putative DNA binding domain-containing protein [Bacilli bacterium]|nr:putative DNA binding domain-containing protein [Bacilli bacterium]MBO6280611.1 putative DNA binding domain-containing protein [Bacilli bacterium]